MQHNFKSSSSCLNCGRVANSLEGCPGPLNGQLSKISFHGSLDLRTGEISIVANAHRETSKFNQDPDTVDPKDVTDRTANHLLQLLDGLKRSQERRSDEVGQNT